MIYELSEAKRGPALTVRVVTVISIGTRTLIKCSCGYCTCIGVPCVCIFAIVNEFPPNIIDIFGAYYGRES